MNVKWRVPRAECTLDFLEVDIGEHFLSLAYNRVSITATFTLKKNIYI